MVGRNRIFQASAMTALWAVVTLSSRSDDGRRGGKARRGEEAKRMAAMQMVKQIEGAIDRFSYDYERFPQSLEELVERPSDVPEDKWQGAALKKKDLIDPWGNPFHYKYPGDHGNYDVASWGADGKKGGEGRNADITGWE